MRSSLLWPMTAIVVVACKDGRTSPSRCVDNPSAEEVFDAKAARIKRNCPSERLLVVESTPDGRSTESGDGVITPPTALIVDLRPSPPRHTESMLPWYRAVGCSLKPEDLDMRQEERSLTSFQAVAYHGKLAAEYRTPTRKEVVLLRLRIEGASKSRALGFLADHFLELLDDDDRRTLWRAAAHSARQGWWNL